MTLAVPMTTYSIDTALARETGWPRDRAVSTESVVAQLAAAVHSATYRVAAEPSGTAELLRRLRGPLIEALDELISAVLTEPAPTTELTAREVEVLTLLARGLTAHASGRLLGISPRTVRKHLEHVYRKLDCSDRLVAVDVARRLGIIG